jgi:hypothetical protein
MLKERTRQRTRSNGENEETDGRVEAVAIWMGNGIMKMGNNFNTHPNRLTPTVPKAGAQP